MMTNESGRSMVEMLGVLAIIGVLSIGGIAGYTQAMKKYRINEAMHGITMASVLCQTTSSEVAVAKNTVLTDVGCSGNTGIVTSISLAGVTLQEVADAWPSTNVGSIDVAAKTYTPS